MSATPFNNPEEVFDFLNLMVVPDKNYSVVL